MWTWLSSVVSQGWALLSGLLGGLYQFFAGLLYLLEQIVRLVGLAVQVVLLATEILFSVMEGVVNTFVGIATAVPTEPAIGYLEAGITWVRSMLDPTGFQVLGYFLAFCAWVLIGRAIIGIFQ